MLTVYLLFAILSGCALWDRRTGRIPNWWQAAGVVAGAAVIWLPLWRAEAAGWVGGAGDVSEWLGGAGDVSGWVGGAGDVSGWVGGAGGIAGLNRLAEGAAAGTAGAVSITAVYFLRILFFLILFFPLFLFRMMGAGDCKTLALIGGYLGTTDGFLVIFYGFLAAAVWSLLYMLRKKLLIKRLHYFVSYVVVTLGTGQIRPYYDAGRDGPEEAFFLAPFFLCGYVFWLISRIGGK